MSAANDAPGCTSANLVPTVMSTPLVVAAPVTVTFGDEGFVPVPTRCRCRPSRRARPRRNTSADSPRIVYELSRSSWRTAKACTPSSTNATTRAPATGDPSGACTEPVTWAPVRSCTVAPAPGTCTVVAPAGFVVVLDPASICATYGVSPLARANASRPDPVASCPRVTRPSAPVVPACADPAGAGQWRPLAHQLHLHVRRRPAGRIPRDDVELVPRPENDLEESAHCASSRDSSTDASLSQAGAS